jgi:hypothetical protein
MRTYGRTIAVHCNAINKFPLTLIIYLRKNYISTSYHEVYLNIHIPDCAAGAELQPVPGCIEL